MFENRKNMIKENFKCRPELTVNKSKPEYRVINDRIFARKIITHSEIKNSIDTFNITVSGKTKQIFF